MRTHYDGSSRLDYNDEDEIRALLIGHSVAKAADDKLTLDDGTVLEIIGNDGCGGCASGNYWLDDLNDCLNIITAVTFDDTANDHADLDAYGFYEGQRSYRIFVYAENKQINLLTVSGDDGNGYYGTGYSIKVTKAPVAIEPVED